MESRKAVAERFGVKVADILSKRRTKTVVKPRHVAMYLAKTMTTRSLPDIGRRFGDQQPTVVGAQVDGGIDVVHLRRRLRSRPVYVVPY